MTRLQNQANVDIGERFFGTKKNQGALGVFDGDMIASTCYLECQRVTQPACMYAYVRRWACNAITYHLCRGRRRQRGGEGGNECENDAPKVPLLLLHLKLDSSIAQRVFVFLLFKLWRVTCFLWAQSFNTIDGSMFQAVCFVLF